MEDCDQKKKKKKWGNEDGGRRTSGTGTCTSSRAPPGFACPRLFLLDRIQEGIWYAQVLYLFF